MRGFLLDSHIPAAVVDDVKRRSPGCEAVHLARWRAGALLDEDDETLILTATEDELLFVTRDLDTVPTIVIRLIREGRAITGVALVPARAIGANDVGGIGRELSRIFSSPPLDPAWPVVYLRPPR